MQTYTQNVHIRIHRARYTEAYKRDTETAF